MKINPINFSSPQQREREKLAALVAKARAELAEKNHVDELPELPNTQLKPTSIERIKAIVASIPQAEITKLKFIWNEEQQAAIDMGLSGVSFNLIGKAGTGKTTVTKEIIRQVQASGRIGPMAESTKYLRSGAPGIAVVSFTNRAVMNIAKGMQEDMKGHTITVHKLLEFAPVRMTIKDANGDLKETMRFLPQRNGLNPLPDTLKLLIFEESSMLSVDLFQSLIDAIHHECQFIFLGDLQQLPPIYGPAILGFKLNELPTVELLKIMRQAEGSPIIDFAWKIASGEMIGVPHNQEATRKALDDLTNQYKKKVLIRPWKKRLDSDDALNIMNRLFAQFIDADPPLYNEREDMIMIPFNKSFGTIEFNKNLAQHLGRKRNAKIYEIIAGFNKFYFGVGDKVLVERQEAIIEEILINDMYKGRAPIAPDVTLNRWGMYEKESKEHQTTEQDLEEVEKFLLSQMSSIDGESEEAKQQASHILVCRILDSDELKEVRTTGEYSSCLFAYALTVHKCQGSEWRKCFLILHHSHATMLSRELLYTAVTRAREELYIICEPDAFIKGVKNQRIRGNTIKEKAEFFKGKIEKEL